MNKNKKFKLIGTGIGAMAALSSIAAVVVHKKIKESKAQNFLESQEYVTGRIKDFATLYLDGEKQNKPTDFLEFTDVPEFKGQKIEIRDTDKDNENKLSWVEIDDNDKKLLICDRNILKGISWDELNEQNLIFGRVVIIEEKKYILRLLSGYTEKKNKENEWDRYVANIYKIDNLPASSSCDLDNSSKQDSSEKLNGDNNSLWHWYKFSSFTQSKGLKSEKFCMIRGFYSTIYSNQSIKDLKYETVGYRPVLELME